LAKSSQPPVPSRVWDPEATDDGPLGDSHLVSAPVEIAPSGHVTLLGSYRVLGTLGRGGMGIVYEVRDEASGKIFALKTIEARFLALPDTNAGRRFTQEIEILERLDHAGIVRLHDYGFVRHPMGYDLAFFVMERLTGETVEDRIAGERLMHATEALHMAVQVTRALAYLEKNGVLHRDIKPANIFIEGPSASPPGRVVLMDFGLARSREFTRLTQTGHVIGTMAYMSPEALLAHECDGRTDVFALGTVLFEVLTGTQPFVTKDATEHVKEIREGVRWPVPLPDEPVVHQAVALIEAMLAADKDRRPNATEVERQASWILGEPTVPPDEAPPLLGGSRGGAQEARQSRVSGRVPDEASAPSLDRVSTRVHPDTESAPVGVAQPPTASFFVEAADDPVVNPATAVRTPDSVMLPKAPPDRAGPTWPIAIFMVLVAAGLAFGTGLSVGRSTAPEPVAEAPPPPPPPAKVIEAPPPPPPPPPVPRFERAEDAYRYGAAAFDRGELSVAEDALGQALAMNPVHPEATYLQARTKLALEKSQEAKTLLQQYKLLRPKSPEIEKIDRLLEAGL
jgi:serine/threonine protein kinase